MALKRLDTDEMVQISGPWTTKGHASRAALLGAAELAGLVPRIDAGHQGLHDAQPTTTNPRLAEIQNEENQIDLRHDTIIRGTHGLLTSLAYLLGDGTQADSLLRLRDFLLPDGLAGQQKSFRGEAGATALLKTRLASDAGMKKLLKETPVLKKALTAYVDEMIDLGSKLGVLEDERAGIEATSTPGDGAKLVVARNHWIRAVNALVANGELAELTEDDDRVIFGPLRAAEKKADRRGGSSTAADVPAVPPADPPATGATDSAKTGGKTPA